MGQRNRTIWILITIFLISALNVNFLIAEHVENAEKLLLQEQAERQEQQLNAASLMRKANQYFLEKKYEEARDECLKAISILSKISSADDVIEKKIVKAKNLLAMIYTYWANDILEEAHEKIDSGKLQEAIKLCNQAKDINPKLKNYVNQLIDRLKRQLNENKYENIKAEFTDNPAFKKKLYNIDVLYEQGKRLYNSKNYAAAKNKFEELLVLDPYNADTISYLRKINDIIFKRGEDRYDATFNKRLAELEWAQVSPVIAKSLTGERIDIASDQPISKTHEVHALQKKLNDIIIKHIAFEDVPVKAAMLFLQRESKKLDLEGKGINIFLRINEKPEAEPAPSKEKAADNNNETVKKQSEKDTMLEDFTEPYLITIVLDNVPLGKAIEYICSAAGLKYTVGKYAVEIYSPDIKLGMETIVLPLEKELFLTMQTTEDRHVYTLNLKTFFTERGVAFPEGASAVFDSKISRLIVRNTTTELAKVLKIVNKLNVPEPQVSIEAKFVEMKQTDFDELGFEWRVTTNTDLSTSDKNYTTNDQINRFAFKDNTTANDPKLDRVFGFSYTKEAFRIDEVIHALNQNGRAEVLSAPKVTTLNGQKAVIKMITEAYYPESWSEPTSTTESSSLRSILVVVPTAPTFAEPTPQGIIFSVTPFIQSDQYTIDLEMQPEVQKFIGWSDYSYDSTYTFDTDTDTPVQQTVKSTLKMPKFKTRTIKTHLKVYDGETVVLGGVLSDEVETVDDRIPILGDIPLVGRFFSSQLEESVKINLLIFTKVELVKPDGSLLRPQKNNGLPNFNDH